jgi:hypothetical protein
LITDPLITDINPRHLPPGVLLEGGQQVPQPEPLTLHVKSTTDHVSHLITVSGRLKVEQPPENRPPHPSHPFEVCQRLLDKMCDMCQPSYRKHFEYVKTQNFENLMALTFLTSIRYLQLGDFLQKREERGGQPINNQELLSYAARSRFV